MSPLTRRALLAGAGATVSSTALGAAVVPAMQTVGGLEPDPLLRTISDYRAGSKAFNEMPTDHMDVDQFDAAGHQTFGIHLDTLSVWEGPAPSARSAIEAMKLLAEEVSFLSDVGEVMFDAVLAYLEAHA